MGLTAILPTTLSLPAISVYGLTLGTIELLAVGFGLLWTVLNCYQYVPIVQTAAGAAIDRLFGHEEHHVCLDDADLPRVDVILPAYQEGVVIEQSIRSIRNAAYPQERLHLAVVVEPDDEDTRAVLRQLDRYRFTELVVPERYPGEPNKPRALNYAFEHTTGEVVAVIDAEDIVYPNLFREAAEELASGRDFVQARLDMVNEDDGWLNTLFRAEYGFWYELVLPAFEAVGYPLPLAGTSCLFKRSLLVVANVERGERYGDSPPRDGRLWTGTHRLFGWTPWDPRNVTEDFELGLFLWERGFDVGYLESTTAEESPLTFDAWMKQRTRWKKGKLQTFLKLRRFPPDSFRSKAHLYWQSFLPHLGPINLAGVLLLIVIANLARYDPGIIVEAVLSLGLAFAVISMAFFTGGYWRTSDAPRWKRTRRSLIIVLTLPVYWLLQWAADVRAIEQAHRGWLGWERIDHHGRQFTRGRRPPEFQPSTVLPTRIRYGALVGIIVVGATLRLVHLDGMSLWIDEMYSIAIRGPMSLMELLVVSSDSHPPLYYALLHGWMATVGDSGASARLLSALFSIATIPTLYRLGVELFDDRVGLIAAGLLSVSTYHVHFGRTARMYSLFGLLAVGSWLFFNRLRSGTAIDTGGYLLASTGLLYTHAFGLLVILAQHGFMALSETRNGISRRRWLTIQGGLAVLSTPVIAFVIWRLLDELLRPSAASSIDWIPIPSTIAVTQTVLSYLGYPVHYPLFAGSTAMWLLAALLLLLALALVVLSVLSYRPGDGYQLGVSSRTAQAAMLLVIPILVPFVASYVFAPIYAPRYTLPASLGLYLLIGAGIIHVPDRRIRRVIVVVFLVVSAAFVGAYFSADSVEDWQTAADTLAERAEPGDVLILQPGWIDRYLEYYYNGPHLEEMAAPREPSTAAERATFTNGLEGYERVWVVAYQGSPSASLRTALSARNRTLIYHDGVIEIYRYGSATSDLQRDSNTAASAGLTSG